MGDFAYYNNNPVRGKEEEDCVTRAITLATKLPYYSVSKLLDMVAYYYDCDKLCINCYGKLLGDIFNFPKKYGEDAETVEEIAAKYPFNTVLIRIDGHLSCSVSGVIFDIWDCSKKLVDCYWIVI